jgi:TP901 family phage tail tape measure protein
MSTDLAVFVKIMGKDGLTPEYKRLDRETMRLAMRTKKNFRSMNRSAMSFSKLVGGITFSNVLRRGFSIMEQGVRAVGQEVVELDQSLQAASAKFGDSVKRGTDAFDQMESKAREVGATTEFTASEAAKGLDFLAMAGFNYAQSMEAIIPLTDLATAAQMDLARASDIASDALGAFGLSMDPADIETSMNRVNDVFARTVTTSNTTMETLFETMQQSGPAVKAAGGELETFAALAGKLGSAGIKGSVAGTNLKNMFLRLASPVKKAQKLLGKLGVETVDKTTGNMRDMIEILGDLDEATKSMGTAQRAAALDVLFGKRAISGASVLLDIGEDKLKAYREELENAQGASKELAGEMRKGLGVQLKVLRSTLTEKGLQIFTQLMGEDDPAEAVARLTEEIRDLDVKGFSQDLRSLLVTIKDVAKFLWENREAALSLGKSFLIFRAAMGVGQITSMVANLAQMALGLGAVNTQAGAAAASVSRLSSIAGGAGPVLGALGAGVAGGLVLHERQKKTREKRRELANLAAQTGLEAGTGRLSIAQLEERKALFEEQSRQLKVSGGRGTMESQDAMANMADALEKINVSLEKQKADVAAGPSGQFGAGLLTGATEFVPDAALGAQSAPVVQVDPSFDVFVNTAINPDGTPGETSVTVAPKVNKNAAGVSKSNG